MKLLLGIGLAVHTIVSLVAVAPPRAARPARAGAIERAEAAALAELDRLLREERPEKRRRAVRELAGLASRAAWERVIEALEDPDPQVADEAQLRLAELADERLVRDLTGRRGLRSSEPLVRLRVAEAFGRMAAVDGEALAAPLDRRDPELSRALVWSLERAAARGALATGRERAADAVEALARGREPGPRRREYGSVRGSEVRDRGGLRGACLLALCELAPERARELANEGLGDDEPGVRRAALRALARVARSEGDVLAAAARLAGDAEPGVRRQAVETLAALAPALGRPVLARLVERLEREPRARVRWTVVDALRELSGMRHGLDARPWRHWLARVPEDWRPDRAPRSAVDAAGSADRTQSFAGMPVLSDRIAFLIDFSGSLWQGKVGERTRKELAVEALGRALEALPEDARFNVVPYTGEPLPFAERLVEPDARRVRSAVDELRSLTASGKGNVYDAIRLALEDPELDTVVLYTDGSPTGGVRWNLDLMVELLLEENRTRGVAFDAVLIDPPGGNRRRWERLAAATGGRVVVP